MATEGIGIGAGWVKTSKNGNAYISMNLDMKKMWEALGFPEDAFPDEFPDKMYCSLFENKKTKDSQPDWRLMHFPRES